MNAFSSGVDMPAIQVPCMQMLFYKAASVKVDQAALGSNLLAYVTSTFVTTLLYAMQPTAILHAPCRQT